VATYKQRQSKACRSRRIFGTVNLDAIPGALIIIASSRMGTPLPTRLVWFNLMKINHMNSSTSTHKERAKRLRVAISKKFYIPCTMAQAYELVALEENFPNWDALSGCSKLSTTVEPVQPVLTTILSPKGQINQLFFLMSGVRAGMSISDSIRLMAAQSDPLIQQGWEKGLLSVGTYSLSEVLNQTGLFSEEVITVLRIAGAHSFSTEGIRTAIEFLKLESIN